MFTVEPAVALFFFRSKVLRTFVKGLIPLFSVIINCLEMIFAQASTAFELMTIYIKAIEPVCARLQDFKKKQSFVYSQGSIKGRL